MKTTSFLLFVATLSVGCGRLGQGCAQSAAAGGGSAPVAPDEGSGVSGGAGRSDAGPAAPAQRVSPYIVVDQFGYLPSSEKIAVIWSAQVGFEAARPFTPAARYGLIDAHSTVKVYEGPPVPWNGGTTDPSSGDKAWWFD